MQGLVLVGGGQLRGSSVVENWEGEEAKAVTEMESVASHSVSIALVWLVGPMAGSTEGGIKYTAERRLDSRQTTDPGYSMRPQDWSPLGESEENY